MKTAENMLPREDLGELVVVPFYCDGDRGELLLCLNVQKTLEVIEFDSITPLPTSFNPFVGVYDYRLGAVPILDLAALFQGQTSKMLSLPKEELKKKRILFCHLHGFTVGIISNRTRRMEAVNSSAVLPISEAIEKLEKNFFNGVIRYANTLMHMLDIEKILEHCGVDLDRQHIASTGDFPSLKGLRVLVVEDSELFRKKILSIFNKVGIITDVVENGAEGLKMILNNPDKYQLIFTDIEMPLMNGIEMVRNLKQRIKYNGKILFNSSISNQSLIDQIQNEKLGEYLIKFNQKSILEKISKLFSV